MSEKQEFSGLEIMGIVFIVCLWINAIVALSRGVIRGYAGHRGANERDIASCL